ncbi:MAG: alcohol dehydrogenase catalytic domain-containing protein [Phycisphaerae bacterium]|nr:alcohol dehydrogenase catalytic domain-containing protein [Phycisphaerae bacterium]
MKVIVSGSRGPALIDRPDPAARDGECVVRVKSVLITPTDVRSSHREPAIALGHCVIGTVERLGAETPANRTWLGKRVAVHPVVRCGTCDRCLGGLSAHCRNRTILGVEGRDGGLAERLAVPIANLTALPDAIDDERASFAVLIGEALEATRQIRVDGKAYITVLGDDIVALITAQVMTRLNAAVRVIARQPATLAAAEKLGVKHRHADEIGRRGDQDVVVDCVGTAESLAFASALVRSRGTVVLKAIAAPAAGTTAAAADLSPIVLGELSVQGSFYGPLPEAIELLGKRAVEVTSLIERRVALDAALPLRSATVVRC